MNTRRAYLGYFHDWCRERGLEEPIEITRPILERYQRWLYHYRKTNGQPLGFRTQHTRLQSIKSFFQWMARQNHLLHNPASEIVLPRMEHRLPKYVLNVRRGRADHPAARRHAARGPARPRHPGDVLLDRHAAHGAGPPEAVRPGHRAQHADDPPGQGPEGPRDPDRRARAGVDRQVPAGVAPATADQRRRRRHGVPDAHGRAVRPPRSSPRWCAVT